MTSLTVGSLFTGIGGIDLGLQRAGHRICWQVENDPYCTRVLEKHWPNVTRYGDIHNVTELPHVDLIAGGFPCQPVSFAGARRGSDDPRWLWPQMWRVVRMVRPRYVLVENVPGLLTTGFGEVAADLATGGYDTEWTSLPAAAFGAPHLRWRIFLLAYSNRSRLRQQPNRQPRSSHPTQPQHNGPQGTMADTDGTRLERYRQSEQRTHQVLATASNPTARSHDLWATEPDVGRVAHGIPHRVDRLRALGNAVVPQVAEWIGHQLADEQDTP